MSQKFTLIGIDGGATKVSGWIVNIEKDPLVFDLTDFHAQKNYSDYEGHNSSFNPVELPVQLKEMENNNFNLTENCVHFTKSKASSVSSLTSIKSLVNGSSFTLFINSSAFASSTRPAWP